MDHQAFDTIAQALAGSATRRGGIRAAVAAVLSLRAGSAAARPEPQGPCGDHSQGDNRCTKNSDCCTGICSLPGGGKSAQAERKGKGKDKSKGKHGGKAGHCRCLAAGKACAEDRNCCGNIGCIDGVCGRTRKTKPVRNGRPCSASDTCADPNATCASYQWGPRSSSGAYCLLATGGACALNQDCASTVCTNGLCAPCSISACGDACSPIVCADGCEFTSVQDAITARQGTPDNVVAVGAGTWEEALNVTGDVVLRGCRGTEVILRNPAYVARTLSASGGAAVALLDLIVDGYSDKGGGNFGGGIFTEGNLTVAGTTVIRNAAWDKGAGVYLAGAGKTVTITDEAVIENNGCTNRGGGALVEGESDLVVSGSVIARNNLTDSYGAAFAAVDGANVTISGTVLVTGNSGGGAGLLVYRGVSTRPISVVVEGDAHFDANTATSGNDGGFVRFQNVGDGTYHEMDIQIRDRVKITGNTATGDGGGISSRWGKVTLSGSVELSGNQSAKNGGAIWISPAYSDPWPDGVTGLSIDGSVTISGNTAASQGGGIRLQGTVCTLSGSMAITGNTASNGGGVSLRSYYGFSSLAISGTAAITGNTANTTGGGLWSDDPGNIVTGGAAITGNTPDNCFGATC